MKQFFRRSVAALAVALPLLAGLTGCASPQVSDYAAEQPVLDLRQYFKGTVDAYGVFTDRSGKVVKRFAVVMKCSWQGPPGSETGVLDEDFTYSDAAKTAASGRSSARPMAATPAPPPMCWARPLAKKKAMPFAGATR